MRRIVSLVLSLCIILSAFTLLASVNFVSAETEKLTKVDGDTLKYSVNGDYVTITGCKELDATLTIPGKIEDKEVKAIAADAFKDRTDLSSVVFNITLNTPEYVETPEPDDDDDDYFPGYWNTPVSNSYVETIGASAFAGCTALKAIEIPISVKTIGAGAFANSGVKDITYPGSIIDWKAIAKTEADFANIKITYGIACTHEWTDVCDTKCDICDETRTAPHNYEWVIDEAGNCGVAGKKHEECKLCHVKRNENTVIDATGNHDYEWVIDEAGNCGVAGKKHEECKVCDAVRNENTVIEATGEHVFDDRCDDTDCNVCGAFRAEGSHAFDDACDADCNRCEFTRTPPHDYEWVIDEAGNCGVAGKKHEECKLCHVKRNENTVINATGNHDYEWVIDEAGNCGVAGKKHEECKVCDAVRSENTVITATGNHTYNAGVVTKAATCKATGVKTYTCTVCKATKTATIAKTTAHKYVNVLTRATLSKNGSIVKKCSVCGVAGGTTYIYAAKTVKLSATSYTYNGKAKTPTVTVKDSKGKTISKSYYTVTYASGRKNVGKYKVTVTFKGNYSGTKTLYFTINPPATSITKLTAAKKALTVSISKKSSQVTGYEIQYATSKKFTKAKTATIKSYKTTKTTLKKLSAKKTYYVRVRTYKTVGKTKYYSGWSTVKYKKTK